MYEHFPQFHSPLSYKVLLFANLSNELKAVRIFFCVVFNTRHSSFKSINTQTQSLSSTEARRIRSQLRDMYHPSPALSLLEKTSFSKAIPPTQRAAETATTVQHSQPTLATKEDEEAVMRGLFGFDEQKMKEELARINDVDKDVISSQQQVRPLESDSVSAR
jgi:hypothetical protein